MNDARLKPRTELSRFPRCSKCGASLDFIAELPPETKAVQCRYCHTKFPLGSFLQEAVQSEKKLEALVQSIESVRRKLDSESLEIRRQAEIHHKQLQDELTRLSLEYQNSQLKDLYDLFCLGEDDQMHRRYDEAKRHFLDALALRHILKERADEAILRWHIVECEFGVEYVLDMSTQAYMPTLTGHYVDDIWKNPHVKSILSICREIGDHALRASYEEKINRLKRIIQAYQRISAEQDAYDVFISVKQGDAQGRMTPDAETALDLYYDLSKQGLRVFNSRKSLKPGEEYEPHILHALHTSKLLIVVASCEEYLDSPWLKNEWRRFRWLRDKEGAQSERKLIVYSIKQGSMLRLSEELGVGMQMLHAPHDAHALDKVRQSALEICRKNHPLSSLTQRIFIELEYGEFEKAAELCDRALDIDPKNGHIYLGQLMIEQHVRTVEKLSKLDAPFDSSPYFARIMNFGSNSLKEQVQKALRLIRERNICRAVMTELRAAKTVEQCKKIAKQLDGLKGFPEAEAAHAAVQTKLGQFYEKALNLKNKNEWQKAIDVFRTIADFRDSRAQIAQCEESISDARYREALSLMQRGEFRSAETAFAELGDYRDSKQQCEQCRTSAQEQDMQNELNNLRQKLRDTEAARDTFRQTADERSEQYNALTAENSRLRGEVNAALEQLEQTRAELQTSQQNAATFFQMSQHSSDASESTKKQLNEVQAQHDQTRTELKSTKKQLAQSNAELKRTKKQLAQSNAERDTLHNRNRTAGELLKLVLSAALFVLCICIGFSCFYLHQAKKHFANGSTLDALLACRTADVYSESPLDLNFLYNASEYLMKPSNEMKTALAEAVRRFDLIEAGGYHTLSIHEDGAVAAAGYNFYGQCHTEDWTDIVHLAAGAEHTAGLRADGTVVATGFNDNGECNVSDWTYITDIDSGDHHTVGLRMDGTVVAAGKNDDGQCDVSDWENIVAVSAGGYHTIGLKSDGTVVAVGNDSSNQCQVKNWIGIDSVAVGLNHTVAVGGRGSVQAVGSNEHGQCDVKAWKNIVAVAAGAEHTVGLQTDGTVIAVGCNDDGQCDVSDWTDIVAINAGYYYTIGLKSDGTVVAVGRLDESWLSAISEWNLFR